MPIERTGFLPPPWEKEICLRVSRLRGLQGWSQEECARLLGITRTQLANVEICRTTLRFSLGWKLCQLSNVSHDWLLSGREPIRPFLDIPLADGTVNGWEHMSFNNVCNGPLRDALAAQRSFVLGQAQAGGEKRRNTLTSDSTKTMVAADMKQPIQSWRELQQRLAVITEGRGGRAALARQFKVTPQAVSEWMRNKSMPSADTALRIHHWLSNGGTLDSGKQGKVPSPVSKKATLKKPAKK